jgi:predicted transcriptional regulator of viral defense system
MTSARSLKVLFFVDIFLLLPTIDNELPECHMSYRARAIALAKTKGIARARDFTAAGIPLTYLKRLTEAGELIRLGPGLYQDPERAGENIAHDLAEAAALVPNGVVSLISALRHHALTTQLPHAVWITIPHKARTPGAGRLPLEIIRASGEVLTAGVEHVQIEGVEVPIYNAAKTVADCFKHRRHVGEDVAIEALRDALRLRKATVTDILQYAKIDRVQERISPYLKALQ